MNLEPGARNPEFGIRNPESDTYNRPVIPLLIGLAGGIALGGAMPGFHTAAVLSAALFAALMLRGLVRGGTVRGSPVPLLFFLGYLSIQPWLFPSFPSDHIVHYAGGKPLKVSGRVIEPPVPYAKGVRVVLAAERIEGVGILPKRVQGRIRVSIEESMQEIHSGDGLSFEARLKKIRNFQNPGGFDYRRHMAFKRIWTSAYVSKNRLHSLKVVPDEKRRPILQTKEKLDRLIGDAAGASEQKAVLRALILGDRGRIPADVSDHFQRAGVGHLLAISGLHIGIVAAVAFMTLTRIFCFVPFLVWRGWTQKSAAVLSILPVVGYAVLAGMSPSTQRAAVMTSLFLLSYPLEKSYDGVNIIAVAAFALLTIYPPVLFSISFQLSFAAVAAIAFGLVWLTAIKKNESGDEPSRWWSKKAVIIFQTSIFAISGTLPFVARYFNTVSLVGIAGNFLVVPVAGFIVVPVGLLGVCMSALSDTAARGLFSLACLILSLPMYFTRLLAQLPFSALHVFTPTRLEIGLYYAAIASILLFYSSRRMPDKRSDSGVKKAAVCLGVCMAAVLGDAAFWTVERWRHTDLRVTYMDVGHGNAALLELPKGYTMLIDGGGFSDNSVFDVGKYVVAPVLWGKKIMKVDTVVLSHPNSDHLNGLLYILDHFKVDRIWSNQEEAPTSGFAELVRIAADRGIPIVSYPDIYGRHAVNGATVDVFYPPCDFRQRAKAETWRTANNNSLVLRLELGSVSFLFPGDIEAEAEAALFRSRQEKLKSTLLLIPHHGSRSSSTIDFIKAVQPEIAVASAELSDWRPLPHPDIEKRYLQSGCRLYITHKDGAIAVSTDGRRIKTKRYAN